MQKTSNLGLLSAVWLTLGSLATPGLAAQDPVRPNIVFILMDDLRWDDIGCAGHPFVQTPHIDRLAKEGVRCRNAFATTPLCSPSRASFLTGLYPHTHQVRDNTNNDALSHRLFTFPRLLQGAGYETAFIGKWHMGTDDSPRPGFDYWVGIQGQGTFINPELNEDGKREKVSGYTTDIFTERAVGFLKRRHAKPFLLYLAASPIPMPHISSPPSGTRTGMPMRPLPAGRTRGTLWQASRHCSG
jgi:arylsulfatase A-like enzyme